MRCRQNTVGLEASKAMAVAARPGRENVLFAPCLLGYHHQQGRIGRDSLVPVRVLPVLRVTPFVIRSPHLFAPCITTLALRCSSQFKRPSRPGRSRLPSELSCKAARCREAVNKSTVRGRALYSLYTILTIHYTHYTLGTRHLLPHTTAIRSKSSAISSRPPMRSRSCRRFCLIPKGTASWSKW
jgi:hypothetical protein